ncbi:MAG: hypothetical protein HGB35_08925, partial [Geobacteraceae bacterium]|nr:hypothetical protein [Geobacteraceae bacterium]
YRTKQAAGEVVFSTKEMDDSIGVIQDAGDMGAKLADLIMEVKQVFKKSFLQKVEW